MLPPVGGRTIGCQVSVGTQRERLCQLLGIAVDVVEVTADSTDGLIFCFFFTYLACQSCPQSSCLFNHIPCLRVPSLRCHNTEVTCLCDCLPPFIAFSVQPYFSKYISACSFAPYLFFLSITPARPPPPQRLS